MAAQNGENIHKGHRQREREAFLARGLEGVPDHKALELLLYYAIARSDVNPLAHRLLDKFGSLSGVFNATYDQLKQVNGIGDRTACLILLVTALHARYLQDLNKEKQKLLSQEDIQEYLRPYFIGARNEKSYLLCLDAKGQVLTCKMIAERDPFSSDVPMRTIAAVALGCNAAYLVLAHNHLTGIAWPSAADKTATKSISRQLRELGIYLHDHLIFVDDDIISMRAMGYLTDLDPK